MGKKDSSSSVTYIDWPGVIEEAEAKSGIPSTQISDVCGAVSDAVHGIMKDKSKEITEIGGTLQIATPIAMFSATRTEEERIDPATGEKYMTEPYMKVHAGPIETLIEAANDGLELAKIPIEEKAAAKEEKAS